MRYQMDSTNAGEMESSAYVALDRDPDSNPAIFVDCSCEPSRTRAEFADECDINKLMAQYEKNGILPSHLNGRQPAYFDATGIPDLQESIEMTRLANEAFMSLNATVRRQFDNDPVLFAQYAADPENIDQMRSWGLAPPETVPPGPQEVKVVSMPDPEPPAPAKK